MSKTPAKDPTATEGGKRTWKLRQEQLTQGTLRTDTNPNLAAGTTPTTGTTTAATPSPTPSTATQKTTSSATFKTNDTPPPAYTATAAAPTSAVANKMKAFETPAPSASSGPPSARNSGVLGSPKTATSPTAATATTKTGTSPSSSQANLQTATSAGSNSKTHINISKSATSTLKDSAPNRPKSVAPNALPRTSSEPEHPLSPRHTASSPGLGSSAPASPTSISSSSVSSASLLSPRSELIARPQRLKKERGTHQQHVRHSSMVQKELPEKADKPNADLDKRRVLIVGEILSTEETYVKALKDMQAKYLKPIKDLSTPKETGGKSAAVLPLPMPDFIKKVFSNVEEIIPIHEIFYEGLKAKVTNWNNKTELGDILKTFLPFLKLYTVYSNNFEESQQTLNIVFPSDTNDSGDSGSAPGATNPLWAQVFPNGRFELDALLITPIQRIPRYVMLLEDLYRHTPTQHPDNNELEKAINLCREVASHVNSTITLNRNFEHLTFMGLGHLLEAHRRLVLEGELTITHIKVYDGSTKSGQKKEIKDGATAKGASLKKGLKIKRVWDNKTDTAWPLELVWLHKIDEKSFEIIGPWKTLTINSKDKEKNPNSPNNANKWYTSIKSQVHELLVKDDPKVSQDAAENLAKRKGRYTNPKSGEVYEGEWDLGRMHGKGICEFLGTVYEGDFELNFKAGTGKIEYGDGQVYEGQFKSGKPHGKGTSVTLSGDKFSGEWDKGRRHGHGEMVWANGASYTGDWIFNQMEGKGDFRFPVLGVSYSGSFLKGKYHGFGSLTTNDGTYAGNFDMGKQTGDGNMVYQNGDVYEGQWKVGLRHGNGVLKTKEYTYTGTWVKDVKHGKATVQYTDGSLYDGSFQDGKRHGKGSYTSPTGFVKSYSGDWLFDYREGNGEITFSTGDKYDGPIESGQPHGNGRMLLSNGMIIEGKWNCGILEGKHTMTISSALLAGSYPTAHGNSDNQTVSAVTISVQEDGQIAGEHEGVEINVLYLRDFVSTKEIMACSHHKPENDYMNDPIRIAMVLTPLNAVNLDLAKQISVTDVVYYNMDTMPETVEELQQIKNTVESRGLRLTVVEGGPPMDKIVLGKEGRDQQIEHYKQCIRNMGKVGIPILCYNFMPWSLRVGRTSYEATTRGCAMTSEFRMSEWDDTLRTPDGETNPEDMWKNFEYFIKRVTPVAQESGVYLALHPDDPPLRKLRGLARIFNTPQDFERLSQIEPSVHNGITFCQGTFSEMGINIPETILKLGPRVHFVHFRDVRGSASDFKETFQDNGQTDMLMALRAWFQVGFKGPIRPDHVPLMSGEMGHNTGEKAVGYFSGKASGYTMLGRLFAAGYMRGLIEAVADENKRGICPKINKEGDQQ